MTLQDPPVAAARRAGARRAVVTSTLFTQPLRSLLARRRLGEEAALSSSYSRYAKTVPATGNTNQPNTESIASTGRPARIARSLRLTSRAAGRPPDPVPLPCDA
ncbi:unnamed protein product [Gadus morhua 'NCC']